MLTTELEECQKKLAVAEKTLSKANKVCNVVIIMMFGKRIDPEEKVISRSKKSKETQSLLEQHQVSKLWIWVCQAPDVFLMQQEKLELEEQRDGLLKNLAEVRHVQRFPRHLFA